MSGVGKGTFCSSLGTLLTCHGFSVSPMKFDGYLNYDAGTLNPFRHGEVFVLDDGTECDLDLGSYERSLNKNLSKDNYLTAGKIFKTIIDKERAGQYLGRDVQFIPHVTGEIKNFVRTLAVNSNADVVTIEVGGTLGDLENSYFVEAMRELRYEEGHSNVCSINVTYILQPKSLEEFKSKPAQFGMRKLMELGLNPDIVVCRSENEITRSVKEKVSIFSDVEMDRIYNLWDAGNIYDIPFALSDMGMDKAIFKILDMAPKNADEEHFSKWSEFNDRVNVGEGRGHHRRNRQVHLRPRLVPQHNQGAGARGIEAAGRRSSVKWIESTDLEDGKMTAGGRLRGIDGLIVPGGFGKRGIEGKISADKAREGEQDSVPWALPGHAASGDRVREERLRPERPPTLPSSTRRTSSPVIDIMPEQVEIVSKEKYGGTMRLGAYPAQLKTGALVHKLYGKDSVSERHRHRYEVNPKYIGGSRRRAWSSRASRPTAGSWNSSSLPIIPSS